MNDDVDEIAVERACAGDRSVSLSRAEVEAALALLNSRGASIKQAATVLGVTPRTICRWRSGKTRPYPRNGVGESSPFLGATVTPRSQIRRWALRNGLPVGSGGPIPPHVMEAWEKAS